MLAYRIQEEVFGGLDRETKKLLERLARGAKTRLELNRRLKPGAVLVREYVMAQLPKVTTPGHWPRRSVSLISRNFARMRMAASREELGSGHFSSAFGSQGLLCMAAFLAGVFHPVMAHLRCNAIGRTALTAFHVQPGLAPRDGHVPCHRLSYQSFGLLAHGFL